MSSTDNQTKKTPKPCPRCGGAAGQGNGNSQCKCKKGKAGTIAGSPAGEPKSVAPAPCDAPLSKTSSGAKGKGDCGCS